MQGLLALGPSGPFPERSEPRWFTHADGIVRRLSMRGYRDAMVENGGEPKVADDIVRRMAEHGCQEVWWGMAMGGRRGRLSAGWDVRVGALSTPAATVIPYVTGRLAGVAPPGTTDVARLVGQPGVLSAYRFAAKAERVTTPAPTRLTRALGMKGRVEYRDREESHSSLAVGYIAATVNLFAPSAEACEEALAWLVWVLLADVRAAG